MFQSSSDTYDNRLQASPTASDLISSSTLTDGKKRSWSSINFDLPSPDNDATPAHPKKRRRYRRRGSRCPSMFQTTLPTSILTKLLRHDTDDARETQAAHASTISPVSSSKLVADAISVVKNSNSYTNSVHQPSTFRAQLPRFIPQVKGQADSTKFSRKDNNSSDNNNNDNELVSDRQRTCSSGTETLDILRKALDITLDH